VQIQREGGGGKTQVLCKVNLPVVPDSLEQDIHMGGGGEDKATVGEEKETVGIIQEATD
jgi:hypothetical protein